MQHSHSTTSIIDSTPKPYKLPDVPKKKKDPKNEKDDTKRIPIESDSKAKSKFQVDELFEDLTEEEDDSHDKQPPIDLRTTTEILGETQDDIDFMQLLKTLPPRKRTTLLARRAAWKAAMGPSRGVGEPSDNGMD